MDKIMGLLMTIFVGFPLTVISMIISWWMNEGMGEREYDDDRDVKLYHVMHDRKHRGLDRNTKGEE